MNQPDSRLLAAGRDEFIKVFDLDWLQQYEALCSPAHDLWPRIVRQIHEWDLTREYAPGELLKDANWWMSAMSVARGAGLISEEMCKRLRAITPPPEAFWENVAPHSDFRGVEAELRVALIIRQGCGLDIRAVPRSNRHPTPDFEVAIGGCDSRVDIEVKTSWTDSIQLRPTGEGSAVGMKWGPSGLAPTRLQTLVDKVKHQKTENPIVLAFVEPSPEAKVRDPERLFHCLMGEPRATLFFGHPLSDEGGVFRGQGNRFLSAILFCTATAEVDLFLLAVNPHSTRPLPGWFIESVGHADLLAAGNEPNWFSIEFRRHFTTRRFSVHHGSA